MFYLACFGGYFITSYIFLRYPHLLHRKKRNAFPCTHISHRGGAGEAYENTMSAFGRAVALGTDVLEVDVQFTADKLVVISHDNNLLKTTGVDKDISSLNYSELPLLSEQVALYFEPGRFYVGSGKPEERKLALLEDVLKSFPQTAVNIDIKENNDDLIKEVSRLIKLYNKEDTTIWGSFDSEITEKCYRENPRVPLLFSLRRVVKLCLLYFSGLLPFFPLRETHLEIFIPSIYLRRYCTDKPTALTKRNFVVWTMEKLLFRPSLFEHLQDRGIQIIYWVLNYDDQFRKAFELGGDGIITDYPLRLRKFLEENPQYPLRK